MAGFGIRICEKPHAETQRHREKIENSAVSASLREAFFDSEPYGIVLYFGGGCALFFWPGGGGVG